MIKKISLIASLLFFLLGSNVFATEQLDKWTNHASSITKKTGAEEPSFKDYVVPGTVGLLIVVGFGSYWLIYRRKQA
ncbi:hypothetical protein [Neobacillus vireti]|uniref:Gram-positive cocci surface proteins LPxTG domain-containing protein n=1 Tax=Neobacillus vireti LMG 21834 TaxID=1131730 RepID=A0AB94IU74_9BACI|nr:hypothetical protein [Neobacillus vireti]ETI70612.1 hypothetical protein BAVI_01520 [Neobacillus vireti LMG 21834]KLT15313.1 hypothetical protein AA980_24405 [Neobacillus vireti]